MSEKCKDYLSSLQCKEPKSNNTPYCNRHQKCLLYKCENPKEITNGRYGPFCQIHTWYGLY